MFFCTECIDGVGKLVNKVTYLTLGYVNTYPLLNLFIPMTSHSKEKLFIVSSINMKYQKISMKLQNARCLTRSIANVWNEKGLYGIKKWDLCVLWFIAYAVYSIFLKKWAENTFFSAQMFWEIDVFLCSFRINLVS